MFERLKQPLGKGKQKKKQVLTREVTDSVIQGNAQQQVSSDSLRSLLKTAIADAEQIVASIKMRAQTEAEAEATRIITQAKLEIQEIKDRAELAAQRQAEEILSAATEEAEITEMEAKQRALQYLARASEALLSTSQAAEPRRATSAPVETELRPDAASKEKVEEPVQLEEEAVGEKVEEPIQLEEEAVGEKVEEPVQLEEEAAGEKIEEPVQFEEEAVGEKVEEPVQLEEEAVGEKVEEPVLPKLDSQALYTGEVELVMTAPVELKLVSRLYNYLQTVPELKILYTKGSWDRGTTITVVLEKSMPLISLISETPGVKVTAEMPGKDGSAAGKASSLLRGGEKVVGRIQLALKEA